MKTLVKNKNQVSLKNTQSLSLLQEGFVRIQVKYVGLCRTDLLVASNQIETEKEELILGHEFSGVVVEDLTNTFQIGETVSVNPFFAKNNFMGLNIDGCLSEFVDIPIKQVISAGSLPFKIAAYLEPVAASLAVLKTCQDKEAKGAVYGSSRIAELTYKILLNEGYNIEMINFNSNIPENTFDYIIETQFETQHINKMIELLKDEGLLVIKSRKKDPISLSTLNILSKELSFVCVNYYDFNKSMTWLQNNYSLVEYLLGQEFHIDNWEEAFKLANMDDSKKVFIYF